MADSSATAGLRYVDPPTNRNLLINGAMQVSQRSASVTGITSGGYYTADRWNLNLGALGTWTQSVEADAPTGSGLARSLKVLCTTADAAPASNDTMVVQQALEGQDLQSIKKGTASAEQVTLSFWVKSNVTGTYVTRLSDADNTRNVCASYTINASATWEQKTITFPADTTGVFDNNNAASLYVQWWLGAGSNRTTGTLATTWESVTTANIAVGQTNLAAAQDNYWQITGVQLETGPVATPFEFEPYEATLRKCQRYYYRMTSPGTSYNIGVAYTQGATRARIMIPFPTTMRTAPASLDTTGTAGDYAVLHGGTTITTCSAVPASNGPTRDVGALDWDVASGLTTGDACLVRFVDADGYLGWSAEL
jgi:hypothetical protein